MDRFLIIADDFTGANDTGVQLTKRGIETHVVLEGKSIRDKKISYVLDTESRALSEEKAYERVRDQLIGISSHKFDLVFKKVDSTIRGNITSELKAVDEEFNPELIIFAPAFPDIGRITKDGIHYVNGNRIVETEFSRDPIKPVLEDNVQKLLELGYNEDVVHHNLNEIRDNNVLFKGARIHTFDSENNLDLEKIVVFAMNTGKKVLWVGSAGLANTILKVNKPFKPALGIVGSLSEVSRSQIRYAENKGVKVFKIDIVDILRNKSENEYINQAVEMLNKGNDLIITSAYDTDDYKETINISKEMAMTKVEISSLVQEILGKISVKTIKQVDISGIFVTGGDTAMGFLKNSNAQGSQIIEEIMTGIPMMRLVGGEFDGYIMVSKAGAFGNEEALYYSLNKIKEVQ
ncbi:MAG: four-carbon acid sugar kinase family protein [Tissierellaceae bacterium]|nr:four-carbon acid sugar kinase family protein [Tissierellaceae bacterium]